jgi:hypothetical protein
MKEQIQQLIANGQTKEALSLLTQISGDALLLQAQYNNGEKQFNLGLIEFSEWGRIQARVNFAALELAAKSKPASGTGSASNTTSQPHSTASATHSDANKRPIAFISYNHNDKDMARKVNDFLKNNNIDVLLDEEDMQAGTSIMQFIQDCIKKADAVVSIVSSKSLQSGWVGQESAASLYAVWLADKKFIPVSLDTVAFDSKFQITALKGIQAKIAEMDNDISEIRQLGSDARDLEDDRKRLFDLQKEFSSIIQRLKSVLMLDISGDNFDRSMAKVLERINHG